MFPLSADGIEIVASLVLLADRRAARRSGALAWTALIVGTVGSLAANVAVARPDGYWNTAAAARTARPPSPATPTRKRLLLPRSN